MIKMGGEDSRARQRLEKSNRIAIKVDSKLLVQRKEDRRKIIEESEDFRKTS